MLLGFLMIALSAWGLVSIPLMAWDEDHDLDVSVVLSFDHSDESRGVVAPATRNGLLVEGRVYSHGERVDDGAAHVSIVRQHDVLRATHLVPIRDGVFRLAPPSLHPDGTEGEGLRVLSEFQSSDEILVEVHATVPKGDAAGDEQTGTAAAGWNAATVRRGWGLWVLGGAFGSALLAFLIFFTGVYKPYKQRGAVICAYVLALVFLVGPPSVWAVLAFQPDLTLYLANSPVGVVKARDVGNGSQRITLDQWVVNIGGVPVRVERSNSSGRQGEDDGGASENSEHKKKPVLGRGSGADGADRPVDELGAKNFTAPSPQSPAVPAPEPGAAQKHNVTSSNGGNRDERIPVPAASATAGTGTHAASPGERNPGGESPSPSRGGAETPGGTRPAYVDRDEDGAKPRQAAGGQRLPPSASAAMSRTRRSRGSGRASRFMAVSGNADRYDIRGGLVVPLYVLILATIGGAINLFRVLPSLEAAMNIERRRAQQATSRLPREIRDVLKAIGSELLTRPTAVQSTHLALKRKKVTEQCVYLLFAPVLGVLSYYLLFLLEENLAAKVPVVVVVSFYAGLGSEPMLRRVMRAAGSFLGTAPPARSRTRDEPDSKGGDASASKLSDGEKKLVEKIEALKDDQQTILQRILDDGEDIDKVADELGLPIDAVLRSLTDALEEVG